MRGISSCSSPTSSSVKGYHLCGKLLEKGTGSTTDDGRAGNGVAGELLVDVDSDTRVGGLVESWASSTGGVSATATADGDVDALGVELSTTGAASRVEREDLVPENVLASSDVAGDGDSVLEVVLDEVISGPAAVVGSVWVGETSLADLEELEAAGIGEVGALARALGKVVHDRAVVRVGPGVPSDGHGGASSDWDGRTLAWLSSVLLRGIANGVSQRLVAGDLVTGQGGSVGGDEAIVLVASSPASVLGGAVDPVGSLELEVLATSVDVLDEAVGSGEGDERHQGSSRDGGVHLYCGVRVMEKD